MGHVINTCYLAVPFPTNGAAWWITNPFVCCHVPKCPFTSGFEVVPQAGQCFIYVTAFQLALLPKLLGCELSWVFQALLVVQFVSNKYLDAWKTNTATPLREKE